ncbi:MAG: hypothetical protein IKM97_01870, partial [Clostridia bacterium]|nr:hypothetical protein [Clostridia bacterium]
MKSKILDIQINEKNFKILLIIGLGIIILCCMAIYLEIGTLVNYNISDNIKLDNNKDIEYYIEQVVTGRKYIQISGWAYKKNKN